MAKDLEYLMQVKYDMEVQLKSIHSPVESLMASRTSLAAAMDILNVKTTFKLTLKFRKFDIKRIAFVTKYLSHQRQGQGKMSSNCPCNHIRKYKSSYYGSNRVDKKIKIKIH